MVAKLLSFRLEILVKVPTRGEFSTYWLDLLPRGEYGSAIIFKDNGTEKTLTVTVVDVITLSVAAKVECGNKRTSNEMRCFITRAFKEVGGSGKEVSGLDLKVGTEMRRGVET